MLPIDIAFAVRFVGWFRSENALPTNEFRTIPIVDHGHVAVSAKCAATAFARAAADVDAFFWVACFITMVQPPPDTPYHCSPGSSTDLRHWIAFNYNVSPQMALRVNARGDSHVRICVLRRRR